MENKVSPWRMMRHLNSAIQIPQLNLREIKRNKGLKNYESVKLHTQRVSHYPHQYPSNIEILKAKGIPNQPDKLF